MSPKDPGLGRSRGAGLAKLTGTLVCLLSVAGLALGLLLARSLGDDLRSTVSVSRSALDAIRQTIEAIDGVVADTAASLDSASGSVDSASAAMEDAVTALEQTADFLEEELPTTIESIQAAMPAAIQTANAIDGTLSALSLFGVDYDPDEPFGESLGRVNTALATLPGELRAQSESLRLLTPSAEELSNDVEELSGSMEELTENLQGFTSLTAGYETTIAEAGVVIDQTDNSVERSLWLIRALIVGMAIAGGLIGVSLIAIGRSLDALHARTVIVDTHEVDEREQETVEA